MQPCNSTLLNKDGFSACKALTYKLPPPSRDEQRSNTVYRASESGGLVFYALFNRSDWKIVVEREGWQPEEYEISLLEAEATVRCILVSPDNNIIGVQVDHSNGVHFMFIRRGQGHFLTLKAKKWSGFVVHNQSTCISRPDKTMIIPYDDPHHVKECQKMHSCCTLPEWNGVKGDFYALTKYNESGDSDDEKCVSILVIRDIKSMKKAFKLKNQAIMDVYPHEGGVFVVTRKGYSNRVDVYMSQSSCNLKNIGRTKECYSSGRDSIIPMGKYTWVHATYTGLVSVYVQDTISYTFKVGDICRETERYSFSYHDKCVFVKDKHDNEVSWVHMAAPQVAIAFEKGILFDSGCYICPGEYYTDKSTKHRVECFEQINVFRSERGKELERNMAIIEKLAGNLIKSTVDQFVLANRHMCTEGRPFLPTELVKIVANHTLAQEVASLAGK